jgi:hypothetical protein
MEVLTDSNSPVLISNIEVLRILEKKVVKRQEKLAKFQRRREQQQDTKTQHRDWIEEKVYEYLKKSPCVNVDVSRLDEFHAKLTSSKRRRHSAETTGAKTTGSSTTPSSSITTSFGLTEAEALQVTNFMPTEPVEIHLMVEELHNRMTEANQEELLKCIASYRTDRPATS